MAKITLQNVFSSVPGEQRIEIRDREFAVVTGPRGSGKTAILRMIAGLEKPTQGEIFVGERKVNDLKPDEREVAMVFPDDALYPRMTIRENVAFGLRRRKFSQTEITRRVQDAAAALAITESLERRPPEVSLEQRQRASVARAVARQPKVILFDEPLARFDAATRTRWRADLRQLHERLEATVLYATRDPFEAMALAEQVIVLRDGRIEQDDAVATVYDTPANLFVAGFLGAPPMNLIEGALKLEREVFVFRESGEGTIEARLPRAEHPALEEWAGRAVVLGLRPEEVEIIEAGKGQEPSFPALVDFVETAGAEAIYHLQTGAHSIVARRLGTPGREPGGRRMRCQFQPKNAHFFDPASTRRVTEA